MHACWAPMLKRELAACCMEEVVKGAGGCRLVFPLATLPTRSSAASTAATAASAAAAEGRSNLSSFAPAR
eukprot:8042173-Pyramimonas_sp.AAC.1